MQNCVNSDILEAGIDEAGRGALAGRVYTACVILPKDFPDDKYLQIKDSKKLSPKKRYELREYIQNIAIAYSIDYADNIEIDNINILQATMNSMHRSISKLPIIPDYLVVDGNYFKTYKKSDGEIIPHLLVKGGDNLYRNIAAASILAKTYHDDHVNDMLIENPDFSKYGWANNQCYGTVQHRKAISDYGITKYHRKTFGCCKSFSLD